MNLRKNRKNQKGAALLLAMIVLAVLSSWAISIFATSQSNIQVADNLRKAGVARSCAESGIGIVRYWLSTVEIPGTTLASLQFSKVASALQANLTAAHITNISPSCSGSVMTIPAVTLDSTQGKSFSAVITQTDVNTLQVDVTGKYGNITKLARVNFVLGPRANTVFDYGVATKGPLSLTGNVDITGVNVAVDASVYIESDDASLALSVVGSSQIAGDVSIVNPAANVLLQGGKAGIGGETGQKAVTDHVHIGVPPTDFPTPDPGHFAQYVTNVIDSTTNTKQSATYENVRIKANTNPKFTKQITLNGVVFIETPNVVQFAGGATITGIIVGNGNLGDDSGTNQIDFTGNVASNPVTSLPNDPKFNAIKKETGTFICAPGFATSFGGNFHTVSGTIASNGVSFYGNAGGTIKGSVINYAQTQMTLQGNSDLLFNRSGLDEVPAGFDPEIVLLYKSGTYSEPAM